MSFAPIRFSFQAATTILQPLLSDPIGAEGLKTRELALQYAPSIPQLMPGLEQHFFQFPQRLGIYALAAALGERGEIPLEPTMLFPFFLHLLRGFLADGEPSQESLRTGWALEHVRSQARGFRSRQAYYALFPEIARNLVAFDKLRGVTPFGSSSPFHPDDDIAVSRFCQDVMYFLEEQRIHPGKRVQDGIQASVALSVAQGIHGLAITEEQVREKSLEPVWRYATLMNLISRHLANRPEVMRSSGGEITRDFPEAWTLFQNQGEALPWDILERIRLEHLPPRAAGEKPRLMVVGIGRDWTPVERYAGAGYDLILVDPDPKTADFFCERKSAIRRLEARHGVKIVYHRFYLSDPEISAAYEGRVDSIEYHNLPSVLWKHIPDVDKLLRAGGVLVHFSPSRVEGDRALGPAYQKFLELDYQGILKRDNIPAVLQSPCERLAYPVGNSVFVLRKPS